MLKDEEIDELIQPIINLYSHIEEDLIVEIAKRFENADEVKGSLEWQLKKLEELGGVNSNLVKVIKEYSGRNEEIIKSMLKAAGYANIDYDVLQTAFEMGVAKITPDVLMKSEPIANIINLSYKSLKDTFSLINTRAIESAKQNYLNIINTAYLDSATGIYSLSESVKRGVAQMAKNGFDGATYIRQGRIVKYSIEGVVRRDTLTAVHKLANQVSEKACEELGTDYVEISQHLGARVHPTNPIANHAGWQGKVFKVNGSDDKYPNLKESTGYPDDILGLGGVNCRHRMFPFFPGISVPNPIMYSKEENEKAYKASQGQRRLEREIRQLKKEKAAMKAIGDNDAVKAIDYKLQQKFTQIDNYCDAHNLKRDYSRELVSEQIVKNKLTVTKSDSIINLRNSNSNSNDEIDSYSSLIGKGDVEYSEENVNKMFDVFSEKHAFSSNEYAVVMTKNNKFYYVKGTDYTVDVESFVPKEELVGATVMHNHPVEVGKQFADSFSLDDLITSLNNKTNKELLITGIKKYKFNFNDFSLSEEELKKVYNKYLFIVYQEKLDKNFQGEYMEQLETLRVFDKNDERLSFYEL